MASAKDIVHLFGNVMVPQMSIFRHDHLKRIVEHNSGFEEITAIAYPFGRSDRANDMRMPVLAGIAIDNFGSRKA